MSMVAFDYSNDRHYHCEACRRYHTERMNQVTIANVIGGISALFTIAGITGVTAGDVAGFVNTLFALVAFVSFIWSQVAHKKAVAAAQAS